MKRRWLLLGVPIVLGHAGCIAFPALAVALGLPVVMPICGDGIVPLLAAFGPMATPMAAMMAATGAKGSVPFSPRPGPLPRERENIAQREASPSAPHYFRVRDGSGRSVRARSTVARSERSVAPSRACCARPPTIAV